MQVTVNGVRQEIPPGTSVSQLLNTLKIPPARVAVEINLAVIDRKAYDQISLNDGDSVEIIGFVGGGIVSWP